MSQAAAPALNSHAFEAAPVAKPKTGALRKNLLLGLGLAAVIAGAGYAGYGWMNDTTVSTDDAYVGAAVAQVNSQISGPIARVAVDDTVEVHKGDVLVEIDSSDAKLALAQAEANYQRTVERVSQYYSQAAQAQAEILAREADVSRTEGDYARRRNLAESGAISGEQLANAKTAAAAAAANLQAAQHALASQNELVRGYSVADHPETKSARAQVEKAKLDLSRTVIRAPMDGIIAQRKAQVGQSVAPGQALMTVTPIDQAYVDANFKEVQLADVHVGQPVTLTSDLYGDKVVFHGHVAGMGGGTGSAFALIPAQNATGNWIKVVQRVPVRVSLDPSELKAHPLRVGLSMTARIDTAE